MGFLVKLDTNGSNPQILEKIIKEGNVDYIAMDIKAPLNSDSYQKCQGFPLTLKKIKRVLIL